MRCNGHGVTSIRRASTLVRPVAGVRVVSTCSLVTRNACHHPGEFLEKSRRRYTRNRLGLVPTPTFLARPARAHLAGSLEVARPRDGDDGVDPADDDGASRRCDARTRLSLRVSRVIPRAFPCRARRIAAEETPPDTILPAGAARGRTLAAARHQERRAHILAPRYSCRPRRGLRAPFRVRMRRPSSTARDAGDVLSTSATLARTTSVEFAPRRPHAKAHLGVPADVAFQPTYTPVLVIGIDTEEDKRRSQYVREWLATESRLDPTFSTDT